MNYHRRHLDESQRGMVAAKLANLQVGRPQANSANLPGIVVSQAQAADMLNISERMLRTAKKVTQEAPLEVIQAVEQGAMSVHLLAYICFD
jgi:hypothetical protein